MFDQVRSAACPVLLGLCMLVAPAGAQRVDPYATARHQMVQRQVTGRGIQNPRVIAAMEQVPRHLFVPANQRKSAYLDAALPLGHGQTITSPYVVSFMTEQLDPQSADRILEIGTGSGYQAAVLSRIVADVYSIEIVEPLGKRAARTISQLGYENIHTKIGDGYQGWPEHAPFDKIIVTCSPEKVPPALVDQLREGGRLIVPLGERFTQSLFLFQKIDGKLQREKLEATFFVPMTGQAEELRVHKDDSPWPKLVNGSFEQLNQENEPTGWFYLRQARVQRDATAPDGNHVLVLSNSKLGANCHAIQAFGIDGRVVQRLELSVRVRTRGLDQRNMNPDMLPNVDVSFYDDNRGSIKTASAGPWDKDMDWTIHKVEIPVPSRARLGTVAVRMFGAVADVAVDQLTIQALEPSPGD